MRCPGWPSQGRARWSQGRSVGVAARRYRVGTRLGGGHLELVARRSEGGRVRRVRGARRELEAGDPRRVKSIAALSAGGA